MVESTGVEPISSESESEVLPLHQLSIWHGGEYISIKGGRPINELHFGYSVLRDSRRHWDKTYTIIFQKREKSGSFLLREVYQPKLILVSFYSLGVRHIPTAFHGHL